MEQCEGLGHVLDSLHLFDIPLLKKSCKVLGEILDRLDLFIIPFSGC